MEADFILRKNIERFEYLLASGTLDATQTAVVTDLLEKEIEALARLTALFRTDAIGPPRVRE